MHPSVDIYVEISISPENMGYVNIEFFLGVSLK